MTKKVCVVVHSRANYARIKSVLRAVSESKALDLQIIVGASALLDRFGNVLDIMKQDGFEAQALVHSIVEGGTLEAMAKSTGLTTIELTTHFSNIGPDLVLTVADRFETMATAIAASYMNIPLAHTQGGEVTGSIDESVRHAITKLAHIHFPATQRSRDFIIRMGEESDRVHLTGCPSIDLAASVEEPASQELMSRYGGVGPSVDVEHPYVVVLFHPVTTEFEEISAQVEELIASVSVLVESGMQALWLWPNVDAGSDKVSKRLRVFRETAAGGRVHFFRNFAPEDYLRVIRGARALIGNSSSGIREGSYMGVPVVNIGSRQAGRERAQNVIDVGNNKSQILEATWYQIARGTYPRELIYGDGQAGKRIADLLATETVVVEKHLNYLD